jgi:DNA-binding response OmpR family regulator
MPPLDVMPSLSERDGDERVEEIASEQQGEASMQDLEMKPMRLLLVEENAATQKEVCDILRFTGHKVTRTGFGPHLLSVMCELNWDGMLLGIGTADGYAWDVLKGYRMWQQRQHEVSSAICLLIPRGDEVGREIAQRWEASYVEKPLTVSVLMGACRHLMTLKMAQLSPPQQETTQDNVRRPEEVVVTGPLTPTVAVVHRRSSGEMCKVSEQQDPIKRVGSGEHLIQCS